MKSAFHHFFRPSDAELAGLLANASICYDANVLLNIYRYSSETQEGLVEVFKSFANRTFLPHQFALEYSRNRSKTIIDQSERCREAEASLQKFVKDYFEPKDRHPFVSEETKKSIEKILLEISEKRKGLEGMISNDEYADLLFSLFDKSIGEPFSPEDLDSLYDDASRRYEKSIPPGYSDLKDKEIPQAYGDFIAWRQLIDRSKETGSDFILVTDDVKEDWRLRISGKTVGPRPELLEEFFKETGRKLWIFTSESFLVATKNSGATEVKDSVIHEVRDVLAASPENESKMPARKKLRASDFVIEGGESNINREGEKLSRPDAKGSKNIDIDPSDGD